MTDRINRQLNNGELRQSPSELYLDAYNLKSTPGGFPANTDFRSAGTTGTVPGSRDRDYRSKEGKVAPDQAREQPTVQLKTKDQSRPSEAVKPKEPLRPTDRKTEANRPEVRLRAGERIQDAINRAPEGSTILIPPGVYNERLNITRDNITLKADGKAVLDLQNRPRSAPAINISDRKNVTIDGFEIRNVRGGDTPTAIRVDGSSENIKIINNDIHHVESSSNAHAIGVFGTRAKPLKNITISNNKLHDLKLGQSEALVLNGNVDGFKITDNKIYNSDNIGIDIIGGEGVGRAGIDRARNGTIARNHINNVDSLSNPTYRSRSAAGIYVDGGKNVVIEDNTVLNSNYGIELASERRGWNTEGITVRNNRISGSHLAGITLGGGSAGNGGVTDSVIENNDLRGNSRPIWRQNNIGNVTIRNNRTR